MIKGRGGKFGTITTYKKFFDLPKDANIFESIPESIDKEDEENDKLYLNKRLGRATPKVISVSSYYASTDSKEKENRNDVSIMHNNYKTKKSRFKSGMGPLSQYLFISGRDDHDENFSKSKKLDFLYYKKLTNTFLQAIFSFISVLTAVTQYELENMGYNEIHLDVTLSFCFISSLCLFTTIIIEYTIDSKILALRKNIPSRLWNKDDKRIKNLLIIFLVFGIHPNPFMKNIYFDMYNDELMITYKQSFNSILTMICFLRLFFILKLYLTVSKYYSPRCQRINQMNKLESDYIFTLKACFLKNPVSLYLLIFVLILSYTTFCLRMFERVLDEKTGYNFDSYWNCMWVLVTTMTTVGYGDRYIKSLFGRIIGVFSSLCGISLISMLIVTITNIIKFTPIEIKVFTMLQRMHLKEQKDDIAFKLITRYLVLLRKLKDRKVYIGNITKKRFRNQMTLALHNFKNKCIEYQGTFPVYSKHDNLVDLLHILMEDNLSSIQKKHDELNHILKCYLEL